MADRETLLWRAKQMRTAPTPAEAALWTLIRNRRVGGLKFRRQVPFDRYIADFYCEAARLIVELDGGAHQDPGYDRDRDLWFQAQGFRVLRVRNDELMSSPQTVIDRLLTAVGE